MENRGKVINKLALLLLSIVILELVLMGDQVESVKAIKKKIFLKKLKKLLPILALVKPKKKIILVPIPVPMFKNNGVPSTNYQPQRPMMIDGSTPPMSFVMMGGSTSGDGFMNEPGFVGVSMDSSGRLPASMTMLPMTMSGSNGVEPIVSLVGSSGGPPFVAAGSAGNSSGSQAESSMMLPTMTMTIQSEPGGNSAIELSTNMASPSNGSVSGNLQLVRPPGTKWQQQQHLHQQQKLQHHFSDHFDEQSNQQEKDAGEHYYSSPWPIRQPLISPAKVFRNEKIRQQPPVAQIKQTTMRAQQQPSGLPILMIKNQWRPSEGQLSSNQQQPFDFDELTPVGPPQMMTFYQTPNGQLHMSPPPPPRESQPANLEQEGPAGDQGGEPQVSVGEQTPPPARQQQQQQQIPPPVRPSEPASRLPAPSQRPGSHNSKAGEQRQATGGY